MRRALLITPIMLLILLLSAPPAWADWRWPLHGEVITPYRNGDDPYAPAQHRGIDIAGAVGDTVVAAAGGLVRFAGTAGSSGLTVSVRTSDGYDTSYLHLSSISVRAGERVAADDRLGAVGTTGVRSTEQPHLHFGVREAGTRHAYLNPLDFLPPPSPQVPPRETPAPSPAPEPSPRAPAPAPAPRAPARAPVPRRLPVSAPRRVPVPAPRPVPLSTPRRVPADSPAPAERRIPAARRVPSPQRAPRPEVEPGSRPVLAPGTVPDAAPGRVPAPGSASAAGHPAGRSLRPWESVGPAQTPRAPSGQAEPRAHGHSPAQIATPSGRQPGGPDLGWVLAC